MNHGDHGSGESTGEVICKVSMALHGGACELVLWRGWMANTLTKFLFSCLACFAMAFFYEGMKFFREVMFTRTLSRRSCNNGVTSEAEISLARPVTSRWFDYMLNQAHVIQAVLHFFQVFISYVLMLIAMTFNIWLCLSIIVGATCGYFLFGWTKRRNYDLTECCH